MKVKQIASLGIMIAATFTFVSVILVVTEPSLLYQGIAGILLGIFAITTCCVFGLRGHRLVVTMGENEIIIGGYWRDQVIPLALIVTVEQCMESVALQLPERRVYIDYSFFENEQHIESFVSNVTARLKMNRQPVRSGEIGDT